MVFLIRKHEQKVRNSIIQCNKHDKLIAPYLRTCKNYCCFQNISRHHFWAQKRGKIRINGGYYILQQVRFHQKTDYIMISLRHFIFSPHCCQLTFFGLFLFYSAFCTEGGDFKAWLQRGTPFEVDAEVIAPGPSGTFDISLMSFMTL